jgi:ATP synthase protein I
VDPDATRREEKLRASVEKQARRMRQAERERSTLLAQSVYLGTLALLFVLPVVGGAYLGNWIDSQLPGYSVFWSVTLIVAGIGVGALNVSLYIRERR